MKPLLVCALALLAFTSAAHAQLGQSEDATSKTYGKPFGVPRSAGSYKIVAYRTSAYDITAGFKEGKAVWFIYKKKSGADWTEPDGASALADHVFGENKEWYRMAPGGKAKFAWHLYGHESYLAELHPEQKALVIWDSSGGVDSASILSEHLL